MDNPFRYIFGGVRAEIPISVSLGEARLRLAAMTSDPITALMEGMTAGGAPPYLLVGFADPDRVRLRTPNSVRWPLWLLAPVLKGEMVQCANGTTVLKARLFIRRWVLVVGALVCGLGISLARPPINWEAATVVVVWLLEFLVVLPRTKRQLLERVDAAISEGVSSIRGISG